MPRAYEMLSFTDAVSVDVMRDLEIEVIYSFDSNLDGIAGIVRLTTVDDPVLALSMLKTNNRTLLKKR